MRVAISAAVFPAPKIALHGVLPQLNREIVEKNIYIYIYTKVSGSGEGLRSRISSSQSFRSFQGFQVLWSLRTAQNRPERAQSRSELLRIAQSAPRAAQSRPERSLRAVRGTAQGRPERAQSCSELLRVAQSAPRAAQSRSESLGACPEPLRAALNRPERSLRAARKTDRGARCHVHFAYQMLSLT